MTDLTLFGYEAKIHATVDIELRNGDDIIYVPDIRARRPIRPSTQCAGDVHLELDIAPVLKAIDSYRERTARG